MFSFTEKDLDAIALLPVVETSSEIHEVSNAVRRAHALRSEQLHTYVISLITSLFGRKGGAVEFGNALASSGQSGLAGKANDNQHALPTEAKLAG